jgi:hypothetical protein
MVSIGRAVVCLQLGFKPRNTRLHLCEFFDDRIIRERHSNWSRRRGCCA